jgi:hypothetical protein
MVRGGKSVGWAKPADAQASGGVPTTICAAYWKSNGGHGASAPLPTLRVLRLRPAIEYRYGHIAFTIASSPSVSVGEEDDSARRELAHDE